MYAEIWLREINWDRNNLKLHLTKYKETQICIEILKYKSTGGFHTEIPHSLAFTLKRTARSVIASIQSWVRVQLTLHPFSDSEDVSEKTCKPSWLETAITLSFIHEKKIFNFIIILPIQWWENPKGLRNAITCMIYNDFVLIYSDLYSDLQLLHVKLSCCLSRLHNTAKSESELCALLVCSQWQYYHISLKFTWEHKRVVPHFSSLPGSSISDMYFGLFS